MKEFSIIFSAVMIGLSIAKLIKASILKIYYRKMKSKDDLDE